jgi:mRNA-capping enzyme
LWIDLTNTTRFYNEDEVRNGYDEGEVKYVKVQCRGHGETPTVEQTNLFIQLCKTFISKFPLQIVGKYLYSKLYKVKYLNILKD